MSSRSAHLPVVASNGGGRADRPDVDAFARRIALDGAAPLRRGAVTTVQINVGRRCNQACHHCHVEAGPKRTEMMAKETIERVFELIDASHGIQTVDITGGAPELNPHFRLIVEQAAKRGLRIIDRCNLTILLEPEMEGLDRFLAEHRVAIVASLPCYDAANVDSQRGRGVFERSITALRSLGELGYGRPGSGRVLDLVYNPTGERLPPPQKALEDAYRRELRERFGIEFNSLLTITNMPIKRFAEWLVRRDMYRAYLEQLEAAYNPATLPHLMCRELVSIGWDGDLYDCDFNQMLEMRCEPRPNLWSLDSFDALTDQPIETAAHCFGCTAGAGSSCGGALEP